MVTEFIENHTYNEIRLGNWKILIYQTANKIS
jgi:hypothetical protein